ncbi:MAG: MATE family efflux transporter, partial [Coriobacteriales bacterium]
MAEEMSMGEDIQLTPESGGEGKSKKPKKGTDEQFNRLGKGKIGPILLEFSIPAIASLIISGLYNILAAIFLGQGVGEIGLAVSTVANPMMVMFMALGMLIGNGGNALAAIRLGEGKKAEAERVLGNTVTLGIIVYAVTVLVAIIFIDPILSISGATEETWELSKQFIQILTFGSIFQVIGMGVNNFIRTAGDPNRALWSMLAGTIVCVIASFL